MVSAANVLDLLPHANPFRFVDEVVFYAPGTELHAAYDPGRTPGFLRGTPNFPIVCVIEGLAQATVALVSLESGPLQPGEVPLLGAAAFQTYRETAWDESLRYVIRPVRMTAGQGIFHARATSGGTLIAEGQLVVARRTEGMKA